MRIVAINRVDGGVSVMRLSNDNDSVSEHVQKWQDCENAKPTGGRQVASVSEIVEADIPTDRTFRDAWQVVGNKIETAMPAARLIQMDRIRAHRDKMLADLDIEFNKAHGDSARQDAVEAQRRVLRDIPKTFDLSSAKTPERLKQKWPPEVLRN